VYLPHTRAIVDFLRASPEDLPVGDEMEERANSAERQPASDPFVYRLQMKKKRQMMALRQMLEDAGYPDLAKMSTVRRERISEEDNNDVY
jgi:hypothetical protein